MSPSLFQHILIVDDEPIIAETLALILQRSGFFATAFSEPLAALNALREGRFPSPDLLITDVVMPTISGIEVAMRIKELCPECEILLFSGQGSPDNRLAVARDKGYIFHFLCKPVHPKVLLNFITTLTADSSTPPVPWIP